MREPISKKLRFQVLNRDCFTCQYCGRKAPEVKLEIDHVIPCVSGGRSVANNLVTACFDCNRGKREAALDQPLEAAKRLWMRLEERLFDVLQEECKLGFSYSELSFGEIYALCLLGSRDGEDVARSELRRRIAEGQPITSAILNSNLNARQCLVRAVEAVVMAKDHRQSEISELLGELSHIVGEVN